MTKFTGRYADSMQRRYNQPDPKPGKQAFYGRLCSGYTKEQAILTGEKWVEAMQSRGLCCRDKKYTPTYSRLQEDEDIVDYTGIDITYSSDVASVFRKEFINVIEKLEWKVRQTDDKDSLKDLYDRLDFAKVEMELFNSYNPM